MRHLLALAIALLAGSIVAQERGNDPELISSHKDWDAYIAADDLGNRFCYAISLPKRWTANRKGVSRGQIYLTVSHRPVAKVDDEVMAVAGYDYRNGSSVRVLIDGRRRFRFFTEGDATWLYDPKQDERLIAAMKRGAGLTLRGTSSRGTVTTDRYSLSGFTAAYKAMSQACGIG